MALRLSLTRVLHVRGKTQRFRVLMQSSFVAPWAKVWPPQFHPATSSDFE